MTRATPDQLTAILDRTRARWRRLTLLGAARRAAGMAALTVVAAWLLDRSGVVPDAAAIGLWAGAMLVACAGVVSVFRSSRAHPGDRQVARYIEEHCPELDDTLVTAVAVGSEPRSGPMAESVRADAADRAGHLDLDRVISRASLRDSWRRALAAGSALVLVCAASVAPATDAAWRFADRVFPERRAGAPGADIELSLPARIERIDLRYEYPAAFGMPPRLEEDGGDIYGPVGTRVRLSIQTDKPVSGGAMNLSGAPNVLLSASGATLEGELTIRGDGSYRIALTNADGRRGDGETEYFIRTLEDRPPDVRILRPATDRDVTPIEEVSIEARADDDFGVAAFDLVFAVAGREETAVPFARAGGDTTVSGRQTIYVEDLGVQPGDLVTYYARARDVSRGKRSSEARSDIFFLQVAPFDEEFRASESNGMSGSGDPAVGDLVQLQKDVVGATWKLDRRARETRSASADDIRALAKAQAAVRSRALASAAQMQRSSDVRRRQPGQARPTGLPPVEPSEEAMIAAAASMLTAQQRLEALQTTAALPFETRALTDLLRAQGDVRQREVQRQAGRGGAGRAANRQQQDLSSLFDRELARQQQTNYEAPRATSESRNRRPDESLDKVRDLARRQESLNREQQALAGENQQASGGGASAQDDERRRRLEQLTREQSELRQQAESLAQQMRDNRGMLRASEQMRAATSDLRRQDPRQAAQRGNQALEQLRQVERQMQGGQGTDAAQQASRFQQESQQIADAQRGLGETSPQRAAEQTQLADRMQRLEQALRQEAREASPGGRAQRAIAEAARELDRQKLSERMREAARAGAAQAASQGSEIARQLDRLSQALGHAGESAEAQELGEQLARMRELREQLADADRDARAPGQGEPWEGAQQLLEELRREGGIGLTPGDLRRFRPGQSSPGTEAWKQDFGRWEELKAQITLALEREEASVAARLRRQQAADRLNAGASQTVPEAYRRLVDRYYRALAGGK